MARPQVKYDVWMTTADTVYAGVPFHIVTGWAEQGRIGPNDRLRPAGTEAPWATVAEVPLIADYLVKPEAPRDPGNVTEENVEIDTLWPKRHDEEDDDVDMIPLIDISLVLLIFFMMTTAVSSFSPVVVPDLQYAGELSKDEDAISILIDKVGDGPSYSLTVGAGVQEKDTVNPQDLQALIRMVDVKLGKATRPPEVRIACHKDLPRWIVAELLDELKKRKDKQQIAIISAEVSERSQ